VVVLPGNSTGNDDDESEDDDGDDDNKDDDDDRLCLGLAWCLIQKIEDEWNSLVLVGISLITLITLITIIRHLGRSHYD
jgi:hypothetical protein